LSGGDKKEVLIIGGGPVGLGMAITLGQRGISCLLVERNNAPSPIPKGQNLTQRTMEHFHFWGAEKALREARTIPANYGMGGVTAYGTLLGRYRYDWLQRELVRPFYFTDNERLPQYATETVLRNRLRNFCSVEVLYGWSVTRLHQDAGEVRASICANDGTRTREIHCCYAAGCDGSRSLTREQAEITQTVRDHDRLMVLLVFRSQDLSKRLEVYPGKSFFCVLHPCLKGYWQFFGRVDLEHSWFFHAPVPHGTTKDNYDFRTMLHSAAGCEFDAEFLHIGFWDLRFAIATAYQSGRIFIAGDAAHSHPPYGGYGVNTGFEDAVNLGWKLSAVLKGYGGNKLLQSYGLERQPVFESTARDFIERSISTDREFLARFDPGRDRDEFEREWRERASGARAEVATFEPNYEGSPIVWSPDGAKSSACGSHSFTARAGHHLAPQTLSSGRNIYEELGGEFTLIGLDAEEGILQAFERAAVELRLPLKIIRDSCHGERQRYGTSLILLRPDQFVAWTADCPDVDPKVILGRTIGR
jgi:4-hydroxyisophthalate hydroxylase